MWSGKPGSNRRHSAWKADALPTELLPQLKQRYKFDCKLNYSSNNNRKNKVIYL